jgi:hypothetical protein
VCRFLCCGRMVPEKTVRRSACNRRQLFLSCYLYCPAYSRLYLIPYTTTRVPCPPASSLFCSSVYCCRSSTPSVAPPSKGEAFQTCIAVLLSTSKIAVTRLPPPPSPPPHTHPAALSQKTAVVPPVSWLPSLRLDAHTTARILKQATQAYPTAYSYHAKRVSSRESSYQGPGSCWSSCAVRLHHAIVLQS